MVHNKVFMFFFKLSTFITQNLVTVRFKPQLRFKYSYYIQLRIITEIDVTIFGRRNIVQKKVRSISLSSISQF